MCVTPVRSLVEMLILTISLLRRAIHRERSCDLILLIILLPVPACQNDWPYGEPLAEILPVSAPLSNTTIGRYSGLSDKPSPMTLHFPLARWLPSRRSLALSVLVLMAVMAVTVPLMAQYGKRQQQQALKEYADRLAGELSNIFSQLEQALTVIAQRVDYRCTGEQLHLLRQQVFSLSMVAQIGVVTPNGLLVCSSWQKHTPGIAVMSPRHDRRFSLYGPASSDYLQEPALMVRYTTVDGGEINAQLPVSELRYRLDGTFHGGTGRDLLIALVDADSGVPLWTNGRFTLPLQVNNPAGARESLFPLPDRYRYVGRFDDHSIRYLYATRIGGMPQLALLLAQASHEVWQPLRRYLPILLAGYGLFFIALVWLVNYTERLYLSPQRRIAQGLKQQQFFNVYQPLVDTSCGRITSVEVLIRWRDPRLGVLTPAVFLKEVEQADMAVELTLYQLVEIRRQLLPLLLESCPELGVAVNVSRKQLLDERCVQAMQQLVRVMPRLKVELTEHELIDVNDPQILANLSRLHEAGVQIALDDFGTGYSGMAYLKHFPIDQLKIDRSFVAVIGTDSPNSLVLEAVIALGRQLRLQLVAEGVETAAQAEHLRRLGVTLHQGWLYAKPLEARALRESLLAGRGHLAEVRSPVALAAK